MIFLYFMNNYANLDRSIIFPNIKFNRFLLVWSDSTENYMFWLLKTPYFTFLFSSKNIIYKICMNLIKFCPRSYLKYKGFKKSFYLVSNKSKLVTFSTNMWLPQIYYYKNIKLKKRTHTSKPHLEHSCMQNVSTPGRVQGCFWRYLR